MNKWIFISASLLPMFFIGCTEHSLGGDSLPNEDVLINFSAGYSVDYDIEVATEEQQELTPGEATRTTIQKEMGVFCVAATEYDVEDDVDCLYGITEESFCHNLYNAKYRGTISTEKRNPINPVDTLLRTYPIEENSAIAAYAYYPYNVNENIEMGDTSWYVKLNLIEEKMLTDYCYTGKIFKTKKNARNGENIDLTFRHAFAKVKLNFEVIFEKDTSKDYIRIESFQMGLSGNGEGLLDLKNGNFYPKDSNETAFEIQEIKDAAESNKLVAETTMYIPPALKLKYVKIVYRKRSSNELITRVHRFEREPNYEKGVGYSIDIWLIVPEYPNGFKFNSNVEADAELEIL
ncbi:MAG: fimbrillin family protein [Bacteroidaceae bacterium]|nr:fimbrillin family protein [Bacteroidaceae bacterium]